jgi:hypothetical protein
LNCTVESAVSVSLDCCEEATGFGLKEAVMPGGSPLVESCTAAETPEVTWLETTVETELPPWIVNEPGARAMETPLTGPPAFDEKAH